MRAEIIGLHSDEVIDTIEAEPKCGIDFCDSCGDCLACYSAFDCAVRGDYGHRWVLYVGINDERIAELREQLKRKGGKGG